MTTSRRQSRAIVPASTDWPPEFADPDAPAWASDRATEQWCTAHSVDRSSANHAHATPDGRRSAAIHAWVITFHPSEKWPGFPDQHWMNSSGLGRIEQAADRARMAESLNREVDS